MALMQQSEKVMTSWMGKEDKKVGVLEGGRTACVLEDGRMDALWCSKLNVLGGGKVGSLEGGRVDVLDGGTMSALECSKVGG